MSFIRYITCSVAAISLIGCAHPINVAPDQSKITRELGGLQESRHELVTLFLLKL